VTYPALTVEVAFVSDPLDTTPTYTDITDQTMEVSTKIGRSRQFDSFQPGTASFTLDNVDRRFDPLHGAGPYFSRLLPNKKIRVSAVYDGTTYELYTGHVDGWPQQYQDQMLSYSRVTATDAFKLLARRPLPDYYEQVIEADTPRIWYRFDPEGTKLVDASGNDRDGSTSINTEAVQADGLRSYPSFGVDLDSQWDAKIPAEHLAFDHDPISVEFWFQASSPPDTYVAPIATIGIQGLAIDLIIYDSTTTPTAAGGVQFGILENGASTVGVIKAGTNKSVCDGLPHHILCTRSGSGSSAIRIYIDGVQRALTTVTVGTFAGATTGATLDLNAQYFETFEKWSGAGSPVISDFAIYNTALSAADALAHYEAGIKLWDGDRTGERAANVLDLIGWPSDLYDVDTGQGILGPAVWDKDTKALDYLQLVEATEQGQLFCDHANGGVIRFRSRSTVLSDTRAVNRQGWLSDNDGDEGFVVRYSHIGMSYDDTELVNRVDVEWVGGTVTDSDQTSIDTYGEQSRTITTLMTSKADAESLASWALNHTKDAFLRIDSVEIRPNAQQDDSEDLAWHLVLDAQIGDRILVVRHPQGIGTEISQELMVEGVEHQIDNGRNGWVTTLRCGPAETVEYWILGTSELGVDTRLAF
jgi:hypothetical protein